MAEPVPAQLVVYPKPEQILTRDEQSAGWGIRVDENNLIHYKNGITGDVCCPSSAVSLPPSHSIENTFYREHILRNNCLCRSVHWSCNILTVTLSDWWRCNSGNRPHFAFVLRALLTNAPNSCPPERLFSMFNATFGEDQKSSFGDYLELAMQSQYNKRNV